MEIRWQIENAITTAMLKSARILEDFRRHAETWCNSDFSEIPLHVAILDTNGLTN